MFAFVWYKLTCVNMHFYGGLILDRCGAIFCTQFFCKTIFLKQLQQELKLVFLFH